MSSLFLIWAVDPTPYIEPSPASRQTLYCGTLLTFSNWFHLSRRWWRWCWCWCWCQRRQRLQVRRQRQQQRQHSRLRRLLKPRGGGNVTQCYVWAFSTTFHRQKHPTSPHWQKFRHTDNSKSIILPPLSSADTDAPNWNAVSPWSPPATAWMCRTFTGFVDILCRWHCKYLDILSSILFSDHSINSSCCFPSQVKLIQP